MYCFLLPFLSLILAATLIGLKLSTGHALSLMDALNASYVGTTSYHRPNADQLKLATSLFTQLLTNQSYTEADVKSFSTLGLSLRSVAEGDDEFAVVSETNAEDGVGYGFYVVRLTRPVTNTILQAPHRAYDLFTSDIIYKILLSGNYLGAAWSSTHRKSVDLCKEHHSFYNSFTRAVGAAVFPYPIILQLHGFNKHSRNSTTDLIVSSTKVDKSQFPIRFMSTVSCLKQNMTPWEVKGFPNEISFLGGTLNVNAANLYQGNSKAEFYHMETSKELRKELLEDEALRNKFQSCFPH